MPNHPGELWPMMYVLGATTLKYSAWVGRFCNVDAVGKIRGAKPSAIDELRGLLKGFCLRRKKTEVGMQLPPMTVNVMPVEAGEVAVERWFPALEMRCGGDFKKLRADIAAMVAESEGKVGAALDSGDDAQVGRYLSGAPNSHDTPVATMRRYVGLQKVAAIAETVREEMLAGAYDKLVIFAWHKAVLDELRERLDKPLGMKLLYGGTDPVRRQQIIDLFQERFKPRIIGCNMNAAGTAIDLTRASQVIFAESDWTPATNAQAAARCHRHGQTEPVNVRVASLAGSLDEQVQAVVARKMRDIKALGLD